MDAVLRGVAMYLFLLVIFRIAGKRTLAEATPFDFVLLLIIAEATQQGMSDDDFSFTNAFLLVATLIGVDIALSWWKQRVPKLERFLEGTPLVLVEDGQLHKSRMDNVRVDETDILMAARALHGLERMDQIKYAVLERNGGITVVPK